MGWQFFIPIACVFWTGALFFALAIVRSYGDD